MKQEHIAIANLVMCLGIFWACICRLNTERSRLDRTVRAKYSLLLGGAIVMGFQPTLFGTWPSGGSTFFSGVILLYLALGVHKWKEKE